MVDAHDPRINSTPTGFDPQRDLPHGLYEFLLPLHRAFTPRQQALVQKRADVLAEAHRGNLPDHLPSSEATESDWQIELPSWCRDQRNQMTGPADDGELTVKLLNSGSPGVMLDVEDSMANCWPNLVQGIKNIHAALRGTLTYDDKKRDMKVGIRDPKSATAIWLRPRGLHLSQAGVVLSGASAQSKGELISASVFDVAAFAYEADANAMKHPLAIYIPKSEAADEALWWRDLFQAIAQAKGWQPDSIKCMALVEAHPLAYQMEEFLYNLREHILGLNLGRWDYMASLIHFNLHNPNWVLPDRNTIPSDVPFFQNLRNLMPELCHKRGAMAIGGMTALFPSREDAELNARALTVLERDKKNEADCLMDGAWTGHPDQNEIAVSQFPYPNQVSKRPQHAERYPDLRPLPHGVGQHSLAGTRAAIRTVIRYRNGVLNGNGASLLDGYMEDLATDRIYRLMIAQRTKHGTMVSDDSGKMIEHAPALVTQLFDEELDRILRERASMKDVGTDETFRDARRISEQMIVNEQFNPM